MAATATKLRTLQFHSGAEGERIEDWYVQFDNDATVELNCSLKKITHASFSDISSGGNANTLSLDETGSTIGVAVPGSGRVTIDATGNSTTTWFVRLNGY